MHETYLYTSLAHAEPCPEGMDSVMASGEFRRRDGDIFRHFSRTKSDANEEGEGREGDERLRELLKNLPFPTACRCRKKSRNVNVMFPFECTR